MSRAAVLAGLAGGFGVMGAWEALAALDHLRPRRLLAGLRPLLRVGEDGEAPSRLERRRLAALAALVLLLGGWLLAGPWGGLGLAALGPALAVRAVAARRRRWRSRLALQAPTAARALADAVGVGHGPRGAIGEAARGMGDPAGTELRRAAAALGAGARTEDAVEGLRARAGSSAWDAIAAAMLLQREAGGDLAGLLRRIAAAQEEGARSEQDARAATAQARFTGKLVCGLPVAGALLAEAADPGTAAEMVGTPLGATLCALAAALQVASLLAIRRLSRVLE